MIMADVHVAEELWSTGMLPEGILERWFVADGARVRAGEAVAAVRIGEALHDIAAPTGGHLTVLAPVNELVDPGCIIAEVHA
ncbi:MULTISPECIES: biotin/lipoyl-containing protein [Methylobacterium]|nr:biotin/lipoyl-containing protein [Methylobacterium radiotolerans]MBP2492799.1 biotin carboxyl carrier protein [Methylobacterium sp. PvP105]MDE3744424.1 biotin attachment protein [Methylobacterium radiotolerans]